MYLYQADSPGTRHTALFVVVGHAKGLAAVVILRIQILGRLHRDRGLHGRRKRRLGQVVVVDQPEVRRGAFPVVALPRVVACLSGGAVGVFPVPAPYLAWILAVGGRVCLVLAAEKIVGIVV